MGERIAIDMDTDDAGERVAALRAAGTPFGVVRRRKILWLPAGQLGRWLLAGGGTALLPPGLPAGCRVLAHAYDHDREAFGLKLAHPSFPAVREGELIPSAGEARIVPLEPGPITWLGGAADAAALARLAASAPAVHPDHVAEEPR